MGLARHYIPGVWLAMLLIITEYQQHGRQADCSIQAGASIDIFFLHMCDVDDQCNALELPAYYNRQDGCVSEQHKLALVTK